MKKVLAFLFAVVIMCSASAALLTASAAGKSTVVTLKPYIYSEKDKTYTKVSSVKGGDTFYVSVELTSVSAVCGFSLRLKYDSSVFGFEKAKEINVPCQTKTLVAGGNDSGAIHSSVGGIRTVALSVPCRYLHSPSCMIKKSDVQSTAELAYAMYLALAEK